MYSLFSTAYQPRGNVNTPVLLEWVRRNVRVQLNEVIEYYKTRVFSIPNQHVLNRLLVTALPPLTYALDRYLEIASTRGPYVGKAMQFTSPITAGAMQQSSFYGPQVEEYMLATQGYLSPFSMEPDTYTKAPVRALLHPINQFDYSLVEARNYPDIQGLAVVEVNIPLLLLQYRNFVNNKRLKGDDSNISTHRFLTTRVLPKMLESHLEWCWLNKVMGAFYGQPTQDNISTLGLAVTNYSSRLEDIARELVTRLSKTRLQYGQLLQAIPCLFHDNMYNFLQLPDMAPTRQVWWLLFLSRFRVMQFLIDLQGDAGVKTNRSLFNHMQIDLQRLLRGNIPVGVMSEDTLMTFKIDAGLLLRR